MAKQSRGDGRGWCCTALVPREDVHKAGDVVKLLCDRWEKMLACCYLGGYRTMCGRRSTERR